MTELNIWKPVDASNPIPKPENERQVLIVYNPAKDNRESKLGGTSPYLSINAGYYLANPKIKRPIEDYFFWDHQWMWKQKGEQAFVYELPNLQYYITEFRNVSTPNFPRLYKKDDFTQQTIYQVYEDGLFVYAFWLENFHTYINFAIGENEESLHLDDAKQLIAALQSFVDQHDTKTNTPT